MPSFSYTARNASGATVEGRLEAISRKGALRLLSGQGLVPLRLDEGSVPLPAVESGTPSGWGNWVRRLFGSEAGGSDRRLRLSRRERLPFLRSLSELVSSGVQTGDAVKMLSRRLSGGPQKALASAVWDDVSQGQSLSDALREHPRVFDEASVSLIEAGEATGNLGDIMQRLVADLEERAEVRTRIIAALAYPIFIVLVALGVVLIFLYFLLPRIQGLLSSLGGQLPFFTRLLIALSEFLVTWGPVIGLGGLLGGVALLAWRKTLRGRQVIDERSLGLPGLGGYLRDADLLRVVQTLGLLLENGITTITALALTERTILNTRIRRTFGEARAKISEGMPISTALRGTGYMPDLAADVLMIGENTGNIVPSLREISKFYRRRQSRHVSVFLGVLSIGVLLTAFAFVALIVFGIILAVLGVSANLRVR